MSAKVRTVVGEREREREKVFVDAIEGAKSKQHEWHLNKGVTKGWCGGLFIRAAAAMLCTIRSKTSTSFDGHGASRSFENILQSNG